MKYRKKPVIIEAVIWDGENKEELEAFVGEKNIQFIKSWDRNMDNTALIHTLEGQMRARIGDYIIKGVQGEFYPCKPKIFKETYEKVN